MSQFSGRPRLRRREAEWRREQDSKDAAHRALVQARRAVEVSARSEPGRNRVVVPLVDVDRLDPAEAAKLKTYRPRPGDGVDVQD
jgi:hypothetical protein